MNKLLPISQYDVHCNSNWCRNIIITFNPFNWSIAEVPTATAVSGLFVRRSSSFHITRIYWLGVNRSPMVKEEYELDPIHDAIEIVIKPLDSGKSQHITVLYGHCTHASSLDPTRQIEA